jgi:hypothetical protein
MSSVAQNRWAKGQPEYNKWFEPQKSTFSKAIVENENNEEIQSIDIVPLIPKIMRAQKPPWEIAARLQDKWLESEGMEYPNTQIAETNLIKMDWLLNYEIVSTAYNNLVSNIANDASIKILSETKIPKLIKNEFFQNLPIEINDNDEFLLALDEYLVNDKSEAVPKFDYYYYNQRLFESRDINELTGAIGGGNLRVFPFKIKIIKTDESIYSCEVTQVGIYLRDSFDFSNDQQLGFFNPKTNYLGKNPSKGSWIWNSDYRDYRDKTGKGGDFLIFSDIKYLDTSIQFNLIIK